MEDFREITQQKRLLEAVEIFLYSRNRMTVPLFNS